MKTLTKIFYSLIKKNIEFNSSFSIIVSMVLFCLGLVQYSYGQQFIQWTKTFGYIETDEGFTIQQTLDGGYIIAGWANFNHWNYAEGYLIKTNADGETQWTKTDSVIAPYSSVQQTTDGGYIITGYGTFSVAREPDICLIKTDSNGDTIWTKTYGGDYYDWSSAVQQTTDGGYIILGNTPSFDAGESGVLLIKTDSNGDTIWTKTFGDGDSDYGASVQQTTDGGYIITGETGSFGAGNGDVWLIKVDTNGDTLWTKTFGGSDYDGGGSVQQTTDGGYIITGSTYSFGAGELDVWLIKVDTNGDTIWTKTFGGSDWDRGNSVQQTTDGGYIITGDTRSFGAGELDVWLIKVDANGDTLWTKTFGGSDYDGGGSVQQTTDGGYIITGSTYSFGVGNGDVWLIKVGANPSSINENSKEHMTKIYPNPTDNIINIEIENTNNATIEIYNVSGNMIYSKALNSNQEKIDVSGFSKGIYIVKVMQNKTVNVGKVVVR